MEGLDYSIFRALGRVELVEGIGLQHIVKIHDGVMTAGDTAPDNLPKFIVDFTKAYILAYLFYKCQSNLLCGVLPFTS